MCKVYTDYIVVTDWEKVCCDSFYLSAKWIPKKDEREELIEKAKNGELYIAYEVPASCYVQYSKMDAQQIFIDENGNVELSCETTVIENGKRDVWNM